MESKTSLATLMLLLPLVCKAPAAKKTLPEIDRAVEWQ